MNMQLEVVGATRHQYHRAIDSPSHFWCDVRDRKMYEIDAAPTSQKY
jgi:hypothetical protein